MHCSITERKKIWSGTLILKSDVFLSLLVQKLLKRGSFLFKSSGTSTRSDTDLPLYSPGSGRKGPAPTGFGLKGPAPTGFGLKGPAPNGFGLKGPAQTGSGFAFQHCRTSLLWRKFL